MIAKILIFIGSYFLFDSMKSEKGGDDEDITKNGSNSRNRSHSGKQHKADSEHRGFSGLNIVQIKNPKTGLYMAIDTDKGKITAHKKTPGPYKGIKIIKGKKSHEKIFNKRKSDAGNGGTGNGVHGEQNSTGRNDQTEVINQKTENETGEEKNEHQESS